MMGDVMTSLREDHRRVPSRTEALGVARRLLADQGTRYQHVCRASDVAEHDLGVLFTPEDHRLLVAAAALHDIGYAPAIAHTGFHPVDGGNYLLAQGYPERLACLVAHHSHADLLAPDAATRQLLRPFERESTLLADALVYADMHSDPRGEPILPDQRIADIERRHPGPAARRRTIAQEGSVERVRAALASAGS